MALVGLHSSVSVCKMALLFVLVLGQIDGPLGASYIIVRALLSLSHEYVVSVCGDCGV